MPPTLRQRAPAAYAHTPYVDAAMLMPCLLFSDISYTLHAADDATLMLQALICYADAMLPPLRYPAYI